MRKPKFLFLVFSLILLTLLIIKFTGFFSGVAITANIGIGKILDLINLDKPAVILMNWTENFALEIDKKYGTSYTKAWQGLEPDKERKALLWKITGLDIQGWFGLEWHFRKKAEPLPPPLSPLPPPILK